MYGSEDVPAYHLFGKHDGVLVVVSLPRHEGNLEVASESEFAVLGRISLGHHLTLFHFVALAYYRLEHDGRALVGPPEYRELVNGHVRAEAYEFLVLAAVVPYVDFVCIHINHFTLALCNDLGPGIEADPLLEAGTHDRGLRIKERNRLPHHVRTHQGTVGIIVLEERNQ